MKFSWFFVIFPVFVFLYSCLNYYTGHWISEYFFGARHARLISLIFVAIGLLSFNVMRLRHVSDSLFKEILRFAGFSWMGSVLIAATVLMLCSLAFFILKKFSFDIPLPVRAYLPAALCLICLASAFYNGFRQPSIRRFEVFSSKIPQELNGYKIAHLSDIHLDSKRKMRDFIRTMEKVNSENPDIVLITGDIIDPGVDESSDSDGYFAHLKARDGVFACLGNHEYYFGLEKSIALLRRMGIALLHNESAEIDGIRITGLGDIATEHISAEAAAAIAGRNESMPEIVLSHQPLHYDAFAEKNVMLVLSGHTHRGQIFPFNLLTRLKYHYFYGRYAIKDTEFYVTSGTGSWGPRMRFLTSPEMAFITLRRHADEMTETDLPD